MMIRVDLLLIERNRNPQDEWLPCIDFFLGVPFVDCSTK